MRHKLEIGIPVIGLVVAAMISGAIAAGQNAAPPSLLEQLQAQYKLVKMGSDSSGPKVTEEGTVLAIQKGGILGTPWGSPPSCPSKYEDGKLQQANKLCTMGRKQGGKSAWSRLEPKIPAALADSLSAANTDTASTRLFKAGEKVYPLKIDVDMTHEKIAFQIVAHDTYDTNPPTYYKSEVYFQFAKGFLEAPDVSKIEDTIAEVFTIDNSSNAPQAPTAPAGQDQQAQAQQAPAPRSAPAAAAAEPPSIQLGETQEQVLAALGQPDSKADAGSKKIWSYKSLNLKITFVNDKVSDVQ
jgi:hypothetical protein